MRTLIAPDLRPSSDEAIRQGLERARALRGPVALCHVMPEIAQLRGLLPPEYVVEWEGLVEQQPKVIRAVRDQVNRIVPGAGEEVEVLLDEGSPDAGILRQAEAWRADLVVVGHGDPSGLERFLLGSVAERVVRYAHAPVLVARPNAGRVVLVATDLSDPSLPAIQAGAREAQLRQASRLIVLHVNQVALPGATMAFLGAMHAALPEDVIRVRRETAEGIIKDALARFDATAEVSVVAGDAVQEVLRSVDSLAAGLLVVGTRGRTGFERVLLGSVAERLVREASASVLAVRLRDTREG